MFFSKTKSTHTHTHIYIYTHTHKQTNKQKGANYCSESILYGKKLTVKPLSEETDILLYEIGEEETSSPVYKKGHYFLNSLCCFEKEEKHFRWFQCDTL